MNIFFFSISFKKKYFPLSLCSKFTRDFAHSNFPGLNYVIVVGKVHCQLRKASLWPHKQRKCSYLPTRETTSRATSENANAISYESWIIGSINFSTTYSRDIRIFAWEEYKYKIQREDVQIEKVPLSVSILCLHVKECVYKNIYTLDIYDDLYYV